jgi:glycosyltransferase involved in cell wall biosynthesis
MNKSIAVVILTFNEEIHIERCIRSAQRVTDKVVVVDSYSTDDTCAIAQRMGAVVYQHAFENHARQFNWAMENCDIQAQWIWRLDADEYIEPSLASKALQAIEHIAEDVNGIYVNRKIVFMGQPLLHGGWYPAPQIKIIRKGFGASEDKWMDEHLVVFSGKTISIDGDQTDENLNDLTWWSHKHVNYASREAINTLLMEYNLQQGGEEVKPKFWGTNAERKRWLKVKYAKTPLFVRPFINFFIRYILKVGFLDGKSGFIWHFMQGYWYRMLVDCKIYELKKKLGYDEERIKEYLIKNYR